MSGQDALTRFLAEQPGWQVGGDVGTINSKVALSSTAIYAFAKWVCERGLVPDAVQW